MTAIDPKVRLATPSDEDEVLSLCHMLWEENALFPMSGERVRDTLRLAFAKKGGMLGVIGDQGKIEGMIYLLISSFWYSDEWYLQELFNYVHPDYRRSTNAKALLSFSKRCSDEIGLPLLIGIISNERTEQKVKLYQRQFHKPDGAFFFYRGGGKEHQQAMI